MFEYLRRSTCCGLFQRKLLRNAGVLATSVCCVSFLESLLLYTLRQCPKFLLLGFVICCICCICCSVGMQVILPLWGTKFGIQVPGCSRRARGKSKRTWAWIMSFQFYKVSETWKNLVSHALWIGQKLLWKFAGDWPSVRHNLSLGFLDDSMYPRYHGGPASSALTCIWNSKQKQQQCLK